MPSRKTIHNKPRRSAEIFDVLIVGGGLSGGTLAAMLGVAGLRVACVDRDPPAKQIQEVFDGRTTAISWGSQKVLAQAGVWPLLEAQACPIRRIDILDGGSPVLLRFGSEEVDGRTFGWIVENHVLRHALFTRMAACKTVHHFAPAQIDSIARDEHAVTITLSDGRLLRGALAVGADGRESFLRDWAGIGVRRLPYHQRAIVCTVLHENPHNNVAVEHFRTQGPFAILPMTDDTNGQPRSSVVWTEHGPPQNSALAYPQDIFDAALNARFPSSYGRVRQIGKRFSFPLSLQHAYAYTAPRIALIADAAHGIHPIAGQGLNLGFRDIDSLAKILGDAHATGDDPGSDALLERYARERRLDNMAMAGATDILNRFFSNDIPGMPALRQTGLRLVARLKPVKRFFMKQAMGGGN